MSDKLFDSISFGENKNCDVIKYEVIKAQLPWVEEFRPSKIADIVGQKGAIDVLKNTLKTGELPNLLFYGPPGTGKTTTIISLGRELYGDIKYGERVMELNASDERGIETVRETITKFAKTVIDNKDPNYLCPDYKIIILDEADTMTSAAQSALRKIMEDTSKTTRFCFICNSINRIIEPIISRCVTFKFNHINNDIIFNLVKNISRKKKINIAEEQLHVIANESQGDIRKAITILQNTNYIINTNGTITNDAIYNILGKINYDKITKIIDKLFENITIAQIKPIVRKILNNGYSIIEIIKQFSEAVVNHTKINDMQKSILAINFDNELRRITEGSDEYLHLLLIITEISKIIKNDFENKENIFLDTETC